MNRIQRFPRLKIRRFPSLEVRRFPREIRRFPRLKAEDQYGPFVASVLRKKFHRPDCKWALEVNPKNKVEFASHAEAVAAGLKPCGTCRA